jgi:putative transferase (TIGR04331 family)
MRLIKTPLDIPASGVSDNDIFLGSWCLKNFEDFLNAKNGNHILHYHWDDRVKFHKDYFNLDALYEKILSRFSNLLNAIHKVDNNVDYWRIIIGPWLRYCLDALFDRYECIRLAMKSGKISSCNLGNYEIKDWCPKDFSSFWVYFLTDEWNEVIFSECIKYHNLSFSINDKLFFKPQRIKNSKSIKKSYKYLLKTLLNLVGKYKRGAVFVAPYTSYKKIFKLQLRLKQIPNILFTDIPNIETSTCDKRRSFFLKDIKNSGFEGFVDELLPSLIPKSYLENFSYIKNFVLKSLPHNPRQIFTSNAYQSDDVFKIWVAEKKLTGTKYYIGQHGGNFGSARLCQTEVHQLKTSDKYLSWGWKSNKFNNIEIIPSIQLSERSSIKPLKKGKILHVLNAIPRYFYSYQSFPNAEHFLLYLNDQLDFLSHLNHENRLDLCIRLDRSGEKRSWDIFNLLSREGFSSNIDPNKESILQLLRESRLCVSTTNTTVFLETLSLNFPTVIFWNPNHSELREQSAHYFKLLEKAEVLFYCPMQAAKKVNSISSNIDAWWFSEKVQTARKKFCERYALASNNWLNEWVAFFKRN